MKTIMICPFCKEQHCVEIDGNKYHCTSCEHDFTEDDYNHELLRQQISCVCSGENATEESPIKCDVEGRIMLTIGHDEAMGLSELELPQVTEIFHDNEAIVWVRILGEDEPTELDELPTSDLQTIFDWLEENYGSVMATDFMWVYYPHK